MRTFPAGATIKISENWGDYPAGNASHNLYEHGYQYVPASLPRAAEKADRPQLGDLAVGQRLGVTVHPLG
jgi:hypothetical protein